MELSLSIDLLILRIVLQDDINGTIILVWIILILSPNFFHYPLLFSAPDADAHDGDYECESEEAADDSPYDNPRIHTIMTIMVVFVIAHSLKLFQWVYGTITISGHSSGKSLKS